MVKEVKLKLENSLKAISSSFNRASVFSCIVENFQKDNLPQTWEIKAQPGITYRVHEGENFNKDEVLSLFKHSTQLCLVRDCFENFLLFLDDFFLYLLALNKEFVLKRDTKVITRQDLYHGLNETDMGILKDFTKSPIFGYGGKIQEIEEKFNISLDKKHKKVLTSLKDIRNCLSHNNGFVRNDDGSKGDDETCRDFNWLVYRVSKIDDETEEKTDVLLNEKCELSKMCLELITKKHTFKIGKQLFFSPAETYEIASSLFTIAKIYVEKAKKTSPKQNYPAPFQPKKWVEKYGFSLKISKKINYWN